MRPLGIVLLLILSLASAFARGGGHVTKFDPNLYGGGWTCITAAVAGVCTNPGGVTALCNGVSSDLAAMQAWTAAMVALNPAQAKLYIPPGSNCIFGTAIRPLDGITNAIVWAYGATVDQVWFGQLAFQDTSTTSFNALVQSFNPNDTSVTVITGTDALKFVVGRWVVATCISQQLDGFPPNFHRFNYRLVTNIVGSVISLVPPLDIACKSTYPAGTAGIAGQGGPASLYALQPTWNSNAQFFGLQVTTPIMQWNWVGRTVTLTDIVLAGGNLNPSQSDNLVCNFCVVTGGIEEDKNINNLTFFRGATNTLVNQSSSTNNLILDSFTTFGVNSLNGTTTNMTITNSSISAAAVGASFAGGSTIAISGSSVLTGRIAQTEIDTSYLSYSNGTFAMSKTGHLDSYFAIMVPGIKYQFGWHNNFQSPCSPDTVFTVTDLREDASNLYADTGSWTQNGSGIATPSTLPTVSCSGSPAMYVAYPAATITQKFSGPADLTQYAAPP
jgi:hypothetical protein